MTAITRAPDGQRLEPQRFGLHHEPMERIAQLVIVPVVQAQFNIVSEFEASSARVARVVTDLRVALELLSVITNVQ